MRKLIFFIVSTLFAACSEQPEVLDLYISLQDEHGMDLIRDLNDEDIQVDSVVWNNQQVTSRDAYHILLTDAREVGIEAERAILFSTTVFVPSGDYLGFEHSGSNHITFYLRINNAALSGKPLAFSFDYETSGRHNNRLGNMTFNQQQCEFEATPLGMASVIICKTD